MIDVPNTLATVPASTPKIRRAAMLEYLADVFGDLAPGDQLVLTSLRKGGGNMNALHQDVAEAAAQLESWQAAGHSAYVRMLPVGPRFGIDNPRWKRGTTEDSSALHAVFVDLDIQHPAHEQTSPPLPTEDEARLLMARLREYGLEPTYTVRSSPGGFYLIWAFTTPLAIRGPATRERATIELESIYRLCLGVLRDITGEPRHIDRPDLARILRIPGLAAFKDVYRHGPAYPYATVDSRAEKFDREEVSEILSSLFEQTPALDESGYRRGAQKSLAERREVVDVSPHVETKWIHEAGRALGNCVPMYEQSGTIGSRKLTHYSLDQCPACGRTGKAWLSRAAGRLKCWSASCAAYSGAEPVGGLSFDEYRHLLGEDMERIARMRYLWNTRRDEEPVDSPPFEMARMSLDDARGEPGAAFFARALTAARDRGVDAIVSYQVGVGVGKTRRIAGQLGPDIAVAVASYDRAEELTVTAREQFGVTDVAIVKGVSRVCDQPGAETARATAGGTLPRWWRSVACPGCPARLRCAAHLTHVEGRPLIFVHALADSIAERTVRNPLTGDDEPLLGDRTLIYDEAPPVISSEVFKAVRWAHPAANPHSYRLVGASRTENLAFQEALARLSDLLWAIDELIRERFQPWPNDHGFPILVELDPALWQAIPDPIEDGEPVQESPDVLALRAEANSCRRRVRGLFRSFLAGMSGYSESDLVMPDGGEARAGVHAAPPPVRELFDLVRALRGVSTPARAAQRRTGGRIDITCAPTAGTPPVFSLRSLLPLPVLGHGTLVMDATAAATSAALEASNAPRPVMKHYLNVELPTSVRAYVHLRTTRFGRRVREESARPAEWFLSWALAQASVRLRAGRPARPASGLPVGVIGHRDLVDALRAGKRGEAVKQAIRDRIGLDVVASGYYGRDSRGSNAFEGCHALITVGDPLPNWGEAERDGQVLGYAKPSARAKEVAEAELQQAHGRLRMVNEQPYPRTVVHVGSMKPIPEGDESVMEQLMEQHHGFGSDRVVELIDGAAGDGWVADLNAGIHQALEEDFAAKQAADDLARAAVEDSPLPAGALLSIISRAPAGYGESSSRDNGQTKIRRDAMFRRVQDAARTVGVYLDDRIVTGPSGRPERCLVPRGWSDKRAEAAWHIEQQEVYLRLWDRLADRRLAGWAPTSLRELHAAAGEPCSYQRFTSYWKEFRRRLEANLPPPPLEGGVDRRCRMVAMLGSVLDAIDE